MSSYTRLTTNLSKTLKEIQEAQVISKTAVDVLLKDITEIIKEEEKIHKVSITELKKTIANLEASKITVETKNQEIKKQNLVLTKANEELSTRIAELETQRTRFTPTQLTTSLQNALTKMQAGLETPDTSRVDYKITKFDAEIKANLTIDEDNNIILTSPTLAEKITPETVSVFRLSVQPMPKPVALEGVRVPNLMGKSRETAEKIIKKSGLTIGQVTMKPSRYPEGTIIGQTPEMFSTASRGYPVELVVAAIIGVRTPNLVGLDKDAAVKLIESLSLKAGKITEDPVDMKPGVVTGQSIPSETVVDEGTAIDLTVSRRPLVKVPDLVGRTQAEAKELLEGSGLRMKVRRRVSTEYTVGSVTMQSVEAGSELDLGATIIVTIATRRRKSIDRR